MEELLSFGSLISLLTLTLLEVTLGIDNVIFVSILLGKLPAGRRLAARRIWMIAGILVRILLLLCLGWLLANGHGELFRIAGYPFSLRNLIMLAGGGFLMVKTVMEIHHKLEGDEEAREGEAMQGSTGVFAAVVGQIVLIDTVFSFDSIITAIGMARQVPVMIVAVIIAMVVMFFFSSRISAFIRAHPTLKMLALSFLVMVGFMLFFEGLESLHHQHIPKGYVYFAMAFAFGVEMLNMRMRKRSKPPVKLREPLAGK